MPTVGRWTGREARALRGALRLSVRGFAEHLGVAVRTISKWEAGDLSMCPRPDSQAILDTALARADVISQRRFQLLLTESLRIRPWVPGEHLHSRRHTVGDSSCPAASSAGDREDERDVERPAFPRLAERAIAGRLLGTLDDLHRRVDHALEPPANRFDLDERESVIAEYASAVGRVPASQVLPKLLLELDELQAALGRTGAVFRPHVLRMVSQLSALIAIALVSITDSATSTHRYWRTAVRAADQAGDRDLRSLVRGRYAVFALYDERTVKPALDLADEAIGVAAGIPCAGAASGHAARAQALAILGRHREAQDALATLAEVFSRLPPSVLTDRGSVWGWSEQRLRHVESHVHSYAGRLSAALTAHDAALALYSPSLYQGRVQVELHRAAALILSGSPAEGLHHTVRSLVGLHPPDRDDALVRRTTVMTLRLLPDRARRLPAATEAYELLGLPEGRP